MKATQLSDRFPNAAQAFRELNSMMYGQPTPPAPAQVRDETEPELQARCESWLLLKGYARRTPKRLQAHHTGKWQVHLTDTKRTLKYNPILMDLLLLDSNRGCYTEIELKVKGGRLTPDQQAMAFRGEVTVCWSFDELMAAVLEWEKAGKRKDGWE